MRNNASNEPPHKARTVRIQTVNTPYVSGERLEDQETPCAIRVTERSLHGHDGPEVGGHGARFCDYLLQRPNWHVFPHQKWFQDEVKGDQSRRGGQPCVRWEIP